VGSPYISGLCGLNSVFVEREPFLAIPEATASCMAIAEVADAGCVRLYLLWLPNYNLLTLLFNGYSDWVAVESTTVLFAVRKSLRNLA